jgi:type IV pilus assembly protein PilB
MRDEKEKKVDLQNILGQLVAWEIVSEGQYEQAEHLSRERDISVSQSLFNLRFTSFPDIYTLVSEHFGIPYVDLVYLTPDPDAVSLIAENEAIKLQVLPLFRIGNFLMVAIADPLDITAMDRVKEITGLEVGKAFSDRSLLSKSIDRTYGSLEEPEKMIEVLEDEFDFSSPLLDRLGEADEAEISAPIADLLSTLIKKAVRDRASDIHINPEKDSVQIKFRIDGVLHPNLRLPKKILFPLVSHIKVMSNLDIAISMRPQDGEFHSNLPGEEIDVRVSVLPTIHGENVVMRILNASSLTMDLGELGFPDHLLKKIERLISRPHGIILVTGPTGSGKTTTLYSILSRMDSEKSNIITVEDPAEYKLAGIHQVQVNQRAGLTFATALRSIVRQDPDIIMIGEIRDLETAEIAVQAALTGHLVLGTLHTNNAPAGITRLVEMGVQPFLVASSVIGIMAQRLVRVICPVCKEPYPRDTNILRTILSEEGHPDDRAVAYHGTGCDQCNQTGYRGRTTIVELMDIDDEIREMVTGNAPTSRLIQAAREKGMVPLLEDGLGKVVEGTTTLEEVNRVVELKTYSQM